VSRDDKETVIIGSTLQRILDQCHELHLVATGDSPGGIVCRVKYSIKDERVELVREDIISARPSEDPVQFLIRALNEVATRACPGVARHPLSMPMEWLPFRWDGERDAGGPTGPGCPVPSSAADGGASGGKAGG
jgi:hypothetical protein